MATGSRRLMTLSTWTCNVALETRHIMTSSTRNGTTEARAHDGVIEMRCIVAILKHVTADVIEMQRNYPVKSFTCSVASETRHLTEATSASYSSKKAISWLRDLFFFLFFFLTFSSFAVVVVVVVVVDSFSSVPPPAPTPTPHPHSHHFFCFYILCQR